MVPMLEEKIFSGNFRKTEAVTIRIPEVPGPCFRWSC